MYFHRRASDTREYPHGLTEGISERFAKIVGYKHSWRGSRIKERLLLIPMQAEVQGGHFVARFFAHG